jgi:hypothetical protein
MSGPLDAAGAPPVPPPHAAPLPPPGNVIKIADLQMDETPISSPLVSATSSPPDKHASPAGPSGSMSVGNKMSGSSGSSESTAPSHYHVDGSSVASEAPTAVSARGWAPEAEFGQAPQGYDGYGQASGGGGAVALEGLQMADLGLQVRNRVKNSMKNREDVY